MEKMRVVQVTKNSTNF